ncbi:CAP domain-containing protein [Gottfriedia luciferensis]|uniref:CAP domain-containing protein n=1 Tax=Gottfriedia luciferensis TaxID=178774 RepID=UPI000B4487CE|nr:CAP domain-containing protein [Gottfriedia luciferensis]
MEKLIKLFFFTISFITVFMFSPLIKDWISNFTTIKHFQKAEEVNKPMIENTNTKNTKFAVSQYIGKSEQEILKIYGKPSRKVPSQYDYDWLIYDKDSSKYAQFGVLNGKVVTIFVAGNSVDISPFEMGSHYEETMDNISLHEKFSFSIQSNQYTFKLSATDLQERPLVSLNNCYAQLYFDRFTGSLLGIRYLSPETLVKQRPYELIYSGSLINAKPLNSLHQAVVDREEEKQIFNLTNVYRKRMNLTTLKWNNEAAKVALGHSKDMVQHKYFDHYSNLYGSLADRLNDANVPYRLAGENISANYVDGIASVFGWINSKGHRINMYKKEYTSLGVGAYSKYYTQNFIK